MKVEFQDSKLQRECADERSRMKAFGALRAKKLGLRLSAMVAASSLESLRHVPGHFHELTANRRGQIAADLDGPYRLIFRPVLNDAERKVHADGYKWSLITSVEVLEIENYHGR